VIRHAQHPLHASQNERALPDGFSTTEMRRFKK
jgi:hypothetical protein